MSTLWFIAVTSKSSMRGVQFNSIGIIIEMLFYKWSFPHSWLITGCVTRLTRQVPLVEQELLAIPEHISSPPMGGVCVTRSLVLYVCCLSFCTFSFGHCLVCSSSIYRFWLPFWYLQEEFADTKLFLIITSNGNSNLHSSLRNYSSTKKWVLFLDCSFVSLFSVVLLTRLCIGF